MKKPFIEFTVKIDEKSRYYKKVVLKTCRNVNRNLNKRKNIFIK